MLSTAVDQSKEAIEPAVQNEPFRRLKWEINDNGNGLCFWCSLRLTLSAEIPTRDGEERENWTSEEGIVLKLELR
ncbi:protein transport protein SEC23-like [Gossypium australe]|uniref:Protein transport protein SEC23-like n=1 Tax=Gossypium australe TaxID=47621 RepID=A0A5B6W1R6_9ROSI|nr:protein transport protein SEC23-like [Gossypium australe]